MIDKNWRDEVLKLANDYCASNGIMLTTLANRIVKDADFFGHLESGGGCNVDTLQRVTQWFKDNSTPEQPKRNGARHE